MEMLDVILKEFKKLRGADARKHLDLFINHLGSIKPDERGKGPDFKRVPKDGAAGELRFRNKLMWLRTIPLDQNETFIALHAEVGGYYEGKNGRYSADILGIWRSEKTTRFAVAELKAGKGGDPVFYALAEGLRNVYLLWQEQVKLSRKWMEYMQLLVNKEEFRQSVWGQGSPFNKLDKKNISLLVIGDDSWIQKQGEGIRHVPEEIVLGNIHVKVSIFSLKAGGKSKSKPYALLPLRRHP